MPGVPHPPLTEDNYSRLGKLPTRSKALDSGCEYALSRPDTATVQKRAHLAVERGNVCSQPPPQDGARHTTGHFWS
jgi:hypothetical protein